MVIDGSVPLDLVPVARRGQVGPDAPPPMRLMAAKALLPMAPEEMVTVVAYLGSCDDERLRGLAAQTAKDLPEDLVGAPLSSPTADPRVLDWFTRQLADAPKRIEKLIVSPALADETVRHLAKTLRDAALLDLIAQNQMRILRSPAIIEALYFNPETRMSTISRAIETAVRNGVRLTHIPGYKEIEESILGVAPKDEVQPEEGEEQDVTDADDALDATEAQGHGLDDETFSQVLRVATRDDAAEASPVDGPAGGRSLHKIIAEMSVSQKVRTAILGSEGARRLLVRDPKRVVAMSVLKSPRLTAKEITGYAQARAVHEDVIREIARNREWTRYYPTMVALVTNPKCPPQQALTFVKMLTARDLKGVSKDKEVPGFIARAAKSLMDQREKRGK